MEGTLDWVAASDTLRWVFVGGKGGVGKTTVCCALAAQIARRTPARRVLLISTDPAHNTSDAFGQKFARDPTPVAGFANLDAMEVDASAAVVSSLRHSSSSSSRRSSRNSSGEAGAEEEEEDERQQQPMGGVLAGILPELQEIAGAMPGIDEAVGFGAMLQQVRSLAYDVVLFDTAPTGHTLRLLALPRTLQRGLAKVVALRSRFGGIFSSVSRAFGLGGGSGSDAAAAAEAEREQERQLSELLEATEEVARQFRDPALTTFVPVMVAEFLSLYETERLVQQLARDGMDVSSVVVNQLVPDDVAAACAMCRARATMQQRYLAQAEDLYGEDFHIVRLPLRDHEIRGTQELLAFGALLFRDANAFPASSSSSSSPSAAADDPNAAAAQ